MSRLIPVVFLTLILTSAFAETEGPPTTIGPFPADPLPAKRHRENLALIGELEAGRIELEDAVEDLSGMISDPREEPDLRTRAADHLAGLTVEVRLEDGTEQEQPRALAAALVEAAAGDPSGWTMEYLNEGSLKPEKTAILVGLMVDERLLSFHLAIAGDEEFPTGVRVASIGVIGAVEGVWAFETLTELAADEALDDELRIAAIGAMAPIGYDRGRDFLNRLSRREGISPKLRAAIEEGLETIDRTQYMTPGAWIMLAVGVILLFGGSAWFIRIAIRRDKKHVFSNVPDGEE